MLNRAQSPVPIYRGLLWGPTLSPSSPSPLAALTGADKCAPCLPWRTAMRIKSGSGEKEEKRSDKVQHNDPPTASHNDGATGSLSTGVLQG